MTTASAADSELPVAELKGSSYTLTALRLRGDDPDAVIDFVRAQMAKAPGFFEGAPMVIDCSLIAQQEAVIEIASALRAEGIIVVGVQGVDPDMEPRLKAAGLALLRVAGGGAVKASRPKVAKPTSAPAPVVKVPTRVVTQPVRGGQQIYAKDSDLVILAAVNRDAEVIADGHIHVWGPLRGKALAGASGDESAAIYARQMDAQLVSIAGNYRVLDDLDAELKGSDVRVSLHEQSIQIESI